MITRRINGGLNGYADRLDYYTRLGLVVLGFDVKDLRGFQGAAKKAGYYKGNLDGLDGQQTRAAIHLMLVDLAPKAQVAQVQIKAAPVTEEKPVAVTPPSLNAPWWKSKEVIVPVVTGGGLSSGLAAVGSMPWQNLALVLLAFGIAGGFLLWRKKTDAKAVSDQVRRWPDVEAHSRLDKTDRGGNCRRRTSIFCLFSDWQTRGNLMQRSLQRKKRSTASTLWRKTMPLSAICRIAIVALFSCAIAACRTAPATDGAGYQFIQFADPQAARPLRRMKGPGRQLTLITGSAAKMLPAGNDGGDINGKRVLRHGDVGPNSPSFWP